MKGYITRRSISKQADESLLELAVELPVILKLYSLDIFYIYYPYKLHKRLKSVLGEMDPALWKGITFPTDNSFPRQPMILPQRLCFRTSVNWESEWDSPIRNVLKMMVNKHELLDYKFRGHFVIISVKYEYSGVPLQSGLTFHVVNGKEMPYI